MIRQIFNNYKSVNRNILFVIYAQFFIQLVHTSFILIFNIYLAKQGYSDENIADITSYRFLGVLCTSLPLGIYIKGKALKPIFRYGCWGMPTVSFGMVYYVTHFQVLEILSFLSGIFFSCLQVVILPFIIRNADENNEVEAISMHHATFSFSMILCSVLISFSGYFKSITENDMLMFFSIMGFISIYFVYAAQHAEKIPEQKQTDSQNWHDYDWLLIGKALLPHFLIAVGAGLTMPFMNLFFYSTHHLDYDKFSLLNFVTFVVVSIAFFYVPHIRNKYGWRVSILATQSSGTLMLFCLAITAFWNSWLSLYLAMFCFILRQPLMNMAIPVTAQLVMKYVGERNQELTSALSAALWSGSWFVSAKIFKYMRLYGLEYGHIFAITATLYLLGTISYYGLILSFEKRTINHHL